jgi:APA family basic amino acid/polyamine antiporter
MGAYHGWANAAIVGGEVRNAERVIPWALVVGTLVVATLYVAVNAGLLHALSFDELVTANSTAYPAAPSATGRAVHHALGPAAATALPALLALSAIGTMHCNVLVFPRVFLSMARDGLLPASLAEVSSATATPNRAIWTLALVGAMFAVVGSYDRLANMTSFGYLAFYALNAIGFLRSDRKGGAWIAVLFLGGATALITASIVRGAPEVLAAVALIAAGVPAYFAFRYLPFRRA